MAATYDVIATNTLTGSNTSYTFTSIPNTYTDLIVIIDGASSSADASVMAQFNSDSGSNYSITYLFGDGNQAISGRATNITKVLLGRIGSTKANTIGHIQNYSNTNVYKTTIGRGSNPTGLVITCVSLWRSTAAISSMTLTLDDGGSFNSGSTFTLYGIKAA